MLPSSPHVKEVYGQRIIPILGQLYSSDSNLASDTLFVDSTTLDVTVAQDVAKQVNEFAQMVDAPVSGGTCS